MISRSLGRSLLFAVVAEGLLVWNTGSVLQEKGDLLLLQQPRRCWEDLALAIGYFKTGELPVAYPAVQRWTDEKGDTYYKERGEVITRAALRDGLAPWRFWEMVPPRVPERLEVRLFPRFDDVGRPLLLGQMFRALGGVAPFLIFWMGALLAFPLLLWLALELDRSGRPLAALLATLGICASAFVADALALTYSPAGFYVLGVLEVAAFAAAAVLRRPTPLTLLLKSALAGSMLAILVACRSGTLLLLPGFGLAALVAAWPAGMRRRWPLWVAACALLFLPSVWVGASVDQLTQATFSRRAQREAPPQHHAVWFGLWTGLGDFDREKGYLWNDAAASAYMVGRGGSPLAPESYDPLNEEILRGGILADVFGDPKWYATILAKRLLVTVSQWNILPWSPVSGRASRLEADSRNYVASYYTLTAHVDGFRAYPYDVEAPFLILMAATLCLPLLSGGREALLLASVGIGCLGLPVAITTAGAIEPMSFGLVYIIGAALALGSWLRLPGGRPGPAQQDKDGVDRRA